LAAGDPGRAGDTVGLPGPPDTIDGRVSDYERAGVDRLVIAS
jgi:hypothetical protein